MDTTYHWTEAQLQSKIFVEKSLLSNSWKNATFFRTSLHLTKSKQHFIITIIIYYLHDADGLINCRPMII